MSEETGLAKTTPEPQFDLGHFDGVEEVDVLKVEVGETGKRHGQALTYERMEKIADYLNQPRKSRGSVMKLAKEVGCSPASIRYWEAHPKMLKRREELLRARALDLMPEALEAAAAVIQRGVEKGRFPKSAAEFAKKVAMPEGRAAQVNVNIDNRRGGVNESDKAFAERFRERVRSGLFKRIGVQDPNVKDAEVEDVSHLPDPTEPGGPVEPEPLPEPEA